MFVFEELNKPVAITATALIRTSQVDENGETITLAFDWIAKFRRLTVPEEEALDAQVEEARAEAREASSLLPEDPDAPLPPSAAVRLADAQKRLSTIQKQAVDYLIGWEIDDGKGGFFPEDENTRAAILGTREFRDSLIEAWKNYLNPNPKELAKNSKTPPQPGRVVALPKKA